MLKGKELSKLYTVKGTSEYKGKHCIEGKLFKTLGENGQQKIISNNDKNFAFQILLALCHACLNRK